MSLPRHPYWMWIRNTIFEPPLSVGFLTRAVFPIIVLYVTQSNWAIMAAYVGPYLIVGAIDIYLRTQFSLRALLVAIITLQIPVIFLFTADTGLGTAMGIILLCAWLFGLGIAVVSQLDEVIQLPNESTGETKETATAKSPYKV